MLCKVFYISISAYILKCNEQMQAILYMSLLCKQLHEVLSNVQYLIAECLFFHSHVPKRVLTLHISTILAQRYFLLSVRLS